MAEYTSLLPPFAASAVSSACNSGHSQNHRKRTGISSTQADCEELSNLAHTSNWANNAGGTKTGGRTHKAAWHMSISHATEQLLAVVGMHSKHHALSLNRPAVSFNCWCLEHTHLQQTQAAAVHLRHLILQPPHSKPHKALCELTPLCTRAPTKPPIAD
jgi:hypothetical protein